MKRTGNLFEKVISIENLKLADKRARKGKSKQFGIQKHKRNEGENIYKLHELLKSKNFKTSEYTEFKIFEGKERTISKLPYFPDRVLHHGLMNVLEPILVSSFTSNTYSCIKGRGVHKASFKLRKHLKEGIGTKYCLKMDIRKFYPSVDNDILKILLRRKIKDDDLLWLLDEIIDSKVGLPLGSYASQILANFYLTYFDHWVKENLKVKVYLRYADDMVILSDSKEELWEWFYKIRDYLKTNLKLDVKGNYQVFPVSIRGIDWVGFKHFHTHTLIRKSIKKNYIKSSHRMKWNGWLIHTNSINLRKKYENN